MSELRKDLKERETKGGVEVRKCDLKLRNEWSGLVRICGVEIGNYFRSMT